MFAEIDAALQWNLALRLVDDDDDVKRHLMATIRCVVDGPDVDEYAAR